MKKAAALCLVLAIPGGNAWALAQTKAAAKKKVSVVTRTVTSSPVDVSRWGQLQLTVKVKLTTTTVGTKRSTVWKVLDMSWPVYPQHTDRSAFISSQALPMLKQEALQIKNGQLQLVSGATDTSYGFAQALRDALSKAGA